MRTIAFIIIVIIVISNVLKSLWNQMSGSSAQASSPVKRRKRSLLDVLAVQKRNQAWMDSAFEFELEYIRPGQESIYPVLRGIREDRTIEAKIEETEQDYLTRCTVYFKEPFQYRIRLFRKHYDPACRIKEPSPEEFVRCGLEIHSDDPESPKAFLTEKRRKLLTDALNHYPFLEMADDFISLKLNGICEQTSQLNSLIEHTVSLAKSLENPDQRSFTSPVSNLPKLAIPEIRKQEFPKRTDEPMKKIPEENTKQMRIPVEQKNTVPPAQTAEKKVDAQSLAEKLFSNSFPGNAEKEFFQTVKGSEVEWEGKLLSVYRFGSDYVLGQGPAVKAVFETAEISGSYSMKTRIKTQVRLPEEAMEILKNQNGKIFRFRGTLEKFEPFAKELILLNGSLK